MGEGEKKPEQPKPAAEEKKPEPPKPAEESKKEEKKPDETAATTPPPPPPQEIVLKVYMHCEGCARKVRRCLKGFDGVEEVITDCKTGKVVVKGEKADPINVLARVQRKSHRQVELVSPIPPPAPPPEEPKKVEEKERKVEIPVITVVLGVYMHCEACAQGLKKRILRLKGVESVEPNLKSSQVTVKGALEADKLADYVYKRMGKQATIIKVEAEKKEEEKKEEKPKEEEKKPEVSEKEAKKEEEGGKDKKEGGDGGADPPPPPPVKVETEAVAVEESKIEVKKNELQYYYYNPHYYYYQQQQQQEEVYPQRFVQEYQHEYPSPQMFSDENPNACSVM